ncbi:hypothetical protein G7059_03680 [Erysipelothrix sp. HDW6A]|uniref:hypothetical protein n=1 Tax=Erysipelothrix sp. HDW6A TaxID=2714928 RepID=UPI001409AA39|nr:hypothetical protein [Erysipelothrix sp. HDW6A]QIK57012.1 hypothetical protein G7059_03680 [Erysipelothrix sp. HDW6A]
MYSDYEIRKAMTREETMQCFAPFDFSKVASLDNFDILQLHKIRIMIFDRIEVLWEATWIDGELRKNTEDEQNEWNNLTNLSEHINKKLRLYHD